MALTLPGKNRKCGSDTIEGAAKVHVDHRIPVFNAKGIEAGNRANPGIVDDHVEPPEHIAGANSQRLKVRPACYVRHTVRHFSARRSASAATAESSASLLAPSTTHAPLEARRSAVERPIPRPAPVMATTLSLIVIGSSCVALDPKDMATRLAYLCLNVFMFVAIGQN